MSFSYWKAELSDNNTSQHHIFSFLEYEVAEKVVNNDAVTSAKLPGLQQNRKLHGHIKKYSPHFHFS